MVIERCDDADKCRCKDSDLRPERSELATLLRSLEVHVGRTVLSRPCVRYVCLLKDLTTVNLPSVFIHLSSRVELVPCHLHSPRLLTPAIVCFPWSFQVSVAVIVLSAILIGCCEDTFGLVTYSFLQGSSRLLESKGLIIITHVFTHF